MDLNSTDIIYAHLLKIQHKVNTYMVRKDLSEQFKKDLNREFIKLLHIIIELTSDKVINREVVKIYRSKMK